MRFSFSLIFIFLFLCSSFGQVQTGKASYYANRFAGQLTANGERFNPKKYTAAHKKLPFGTKVLVTNLANNKSIIVRINDRGPYVNGRIIDLSHAAAKKLGFIKQGVTDVSIKIIDEDTEVTGKLIKEFTGKEEEKQLGVSPTTVDDSAIVKETTFYKLNLTRSIPGGYGIQIGSFEDADGLFSMANSLIVKYQKRVTLEVKVVEDVKIFSLILGNFSSQKKAKEFNKEVQKSYPGAFVMSFAEATD